MKAKGELRKKDNTHNTHSTHNMSNGSKDSNGGRSVLGLSVNGGMRGGGSEKKCAIVSIDDVPDYMKGNKYIWTGYRINYTWKDTLLSLFTLHNGKNFTEICFVSLLCFCF